jgi:Ca-activated chloride channel family protein
LILTGRFTSAGRGTIRLKGKMAGSDFVREIPVELPETMALHDVLAPLWARARVDNLMTEDFAGLQSGNMRAELKDTITQLGIEYRLMTQFTSFVAVEEMIVTDGGQPRRIDVPVEVPQGVKNEEIDDSITVAIPKAQANFSYMRSAAPSSPRVMRYSGVLNGRAVGAGGGGGVGPGKAGNIGTGTGTAQGVGAVISPTPTPDLKVSERGRQLDELQLKLPRSLLAILAKLQRKETLTSADEGGFIHNGKAEVQVWMSEKSPASLAKLKELGFELVLDAKASRLIIGRISVDKIEALARLSFVTYVSPQVSK